MATRYQPLTQWPARKPVTVGRIPSPFRTTPADSMALLDLELARIRATDAVVQVDLPANRLRRDERPYSDRAPRTPPCVLTFTVNKNGTQSVTIACDRFTSFWANLHAIALTLHDLRRIDRYGTAASGEQYRGWTALPATITTAMTVEQAAGLLGRFATMAPALILADRYQARAALRVTLSKVHPDAGGRSEDFALATDAGRILAKHHNVEKL